MTHRTSSLTGKEGFISSQDWHEVDMDAKHVDDSMNDLSMVPGSAMNTSQFKHESGWSSHEQSPAFNHNTEFEPLMGDYAVHNGPAPMNISFDPTSQPTQTGPTPTASANAMTIAPPTQFPMSPQQQTWLPTQVSDGFDFSPLAPQSTRHTPVFATSTSILRRDGIRKKNARFEIPAERNLRTIDQLIAQTSDESEIKELKQQKRLLRNRQAALDSRQRKKQHTERLEEEKKQYTNLLTELDEELGAVKLREAEWMRQRDELLQTNSRLHQWCQQVQADKEEAIRVHTVESGQLRKENSMLLEQLQRFEAVQLNAPGSSGLPTEFSDFEQLTIQASPWDNFPLQNSFNMESNASNDENLAITGKSANSSDRKEEQPPAAGLLLMLLLCGAWMLSKGPSSGSDILPSVPDELRAASATVIEDLYKNSGVNLPGSSTSGDAPTNTGVEATRNSETVCTDMINGPALQSFDTEGVTEHLSQLSPRSGSFDPTVSRAACTREDESHGMGNILREALRSVHVIKGQQGSSPERYARSLLVDRVPSEVLKDFAQMVARHRTPKQDTTVLEQDQTSYD